MTTFSDRVERISISGIREVFEAAGDDAINLGLGQPDFPTPDHARRAAVDAIESGRVHREQGHLVAAGGHRREASGRPGDRPRPRKRHRDRGR
jgi:hypothetical protein